MPKTLILCVDRDDDIGTKLGRSGPIVGRTENLKIANDLLLKDPEEVDGNTIFEAVKIFDELKAKGEDVEIATLTGKPSRDIAADREISAQLDEVLRIFPAESCVFVSDGADDEQILPIINSRLKVDSIRQISMKQSKALERTYFLILEKLKEPYFARLFMGVPAIILLGLVISYSLGLEWRPVAALLGLYLLAKGFGIEDRVLGIISDLRFRATEVSTLSYVISVPLLLLALWMGVEEYLTRIGMVDSLKATAYALRTFILFLVAPLFFLFIARVYDNVRAGRSLATLRVILYSVLLALALYISWSFANWVVAEIPFASLVNILIISIIMGVASAELFNYIKADMIKGKDIVGKEVYTQTGNYLGKAVSANDEKKEFIVINPWKKREAYPYRAVNDIEKRVIVER